MTLEPDQLMGLRPKDDSSAEIAAALERIDAEAAATEARIQAFSQQRGEILLTGGDEAIRVCEQNLSAARLDLEQLTALRPRVAAMLPEARMRETRDDLAERRAHLAAELAEVDRWLLADYPALAAPIAGGLQRLEELLRQAAGYQRQLENQPDAIKQDPALRLRGSGVRTAGGHYTTVALSDLVRLPGVTDHPSAPISPFWWGRLNPR